MFKFAYKVMKLNHKVLMLNLFKHLTEYFLQTKIFGHYNKINIKIFMIKTYLLL